MVCHNGAVMHPWCELLWLSCWHVCCAAQVVAAMDEVASNAEGEMAVQAEVQAQERVGKVLKAIEVEKLIAGQTRRCVPFFLHNHPLESEQNV